MLVLGNPNIIQVKDVCTLLQYISKNSTSLFVHYYKGIVLEDLRGLVDFTVKLNANYKQRGAQRKLQHFVVNRMSRDIISVAFFI